MYQRWNTTRTAAQAARSLALGSRFWSPASSIFNTTEAAVQSDCRADGRGRLPGADAVPHRAERDHVSRSEAIRAAVRDWVDVA